MILLDYGYSHLPISALTYGIIVDNAQSLRAAVMGFVGTDHLPGPDIGSPHHFAA